MLVSTCRVAPTPRYHPMAGAALGCTPRDVFSSDVRALGKGVFSLCLCRAQAGGRPFSSCLARPLGCEPKRRGLVEKGCSGVKHLLCTLARRTLAAKLQCVHVAASVGKGAPWAGAMVVLSSGCARPRGHSKHSTVTATELIQTMSSTRTGVNVHTTCVSVYCNLGDRMYKASKSCL